MSTGLIIVIVVVVVVVVALIGVAVAMPQMRSRRLQQQFGPEYERTVAQHDGNTKAAEQELSERVKRTRELDLHPLDPAQQERYLARWTALQEQFVDAPGKAVIDADHLLTEVLRERGYPDDDQDVALSVDHTRALEGYRVSRNAAERAGQGSATTEELRDAFVRARETFDELVRDDSGSTDQRFFQDSVTEKLRDRWQSVQIDFVDDPRSAVEQAESLVEQVSTQLTEALAARRRELHGSWSKDGGTASAAHDDGVPTEDLRTALQAYRQVFNQLLAL